MRRSVAMRARWWLLRWLEKRMIDADRTNRSSLNAKHTVGLIGSTWGSAESCINRSMADWSMRSSATWHWRIEWTYWFMECSPVTSAIASAAWLINAAHKDRNLFVFSYIVEKLARPRSEKTSGGDEQWPWLNCWDSQLMVLPLEVTDHQITRPVKLALAIFLAWLFGDKKPQRFAFETIVSQFILDIRFTWFG